MGVKKSGEPVAVLAEAEIPVFLFQLSDFSPLWPKRTIFSAFVVGKELFLADAVEPPVLRTVNVALVVESLKDPLDAALMQGIGRRRPPVEADVEPLPERDKLFRGLRDKFLRAHPDGCCSLLDLLPVLVDSS